MPLTVPDSDSLLEHMKRTAWDSTEDEDYAEIALQQATDLMSMATGYTTDPTDPLHARIMRWGILDMAWAIMTRHDDKEEEFSPYDSERIGSYSYTKKRVEDKSDTGVEWFDYAVAFFNSLLEDDNEGLAWVDSECVFKRHPTKPELDIPVDPYRWPWHDPSHVYFGG